MEFRVVSAFVAVCIYFMYRKLYSCECWVCCLIFFFFWGVGCRRGAYSIYISSLYIHIFIIGLLFLVVTRCVCVCVFCYTWRCHMCVCVCVVFSCVYMSNRLLSSHSSLFEGFCLSSSSAAEYCACVWNCFRSLSFALFVYILRLSYSLSVYLYIYI